MNQRKTPSGLLTLAPLLVILLPACGQLRYQTTLPFGAGLEYEAGEPVAPALDSPATDSVLNELERDRADVGDAGAVGLRETPARSGASERSFDTDLLAMPPRKPYAETGVRLEVFHDSLTFSELEVEFDGGTTFTLPDSERDRTGFRATFGRGVGGFFQLYAEEFRAPNLLVTDFGNVGLGGGVAGAPQVGSTGKLEFLIPFRAEIDITAGSEDVGAYTLEFVYADVVLEAGFGVRFFGLQPSVGVSVNSIGGLFESDDPSSPAHIDPATVTGQNVGVFGELLYKHDNVPVVARLRAIGGDTSGVMLSIGVAF
ncbi:MAG: hypothetical protein KDC98_04035 [Planctomycetes bacterium]|nr:hypothetical protein [Planctomycetota bacterium]